MYMGKPSKLEKFKLNFEYLPSEPNHRKCAIVKA